MHGSPTVRGDAAKTVFTIHEARAAGMTDHQLRDPRLTSPTPGIRVWDGPEPPWTETAQAISSLPGDHYLSHTTAARLWGLWLPPRWDQDRPVHVTGRKGATGARRRPGVIGHRAALGDRDVVEVGAFRLTSPERTWLDVATLIADHDALVAAGDALLQRRDGPPRPPGVLGSNPLSSFAAIDAVLARRRRTKGITAARGAREYLRAGVDSAPETKIRMIIIGAGLPEPVVNEAVWLSPTVRRRPDLHYPQWRIAIQYDGRGHEAVGQLNSDIHRDDDFSAHDWVTVRAASDIYTRDGEWRFLDRLRRAITRQQRSQRGA
ncbi:MAG: hypothetical protein QJR09_03160 [Micrococcus sp.]|nr:hypothetical protein [Micrococcus sp.]